jgi:hypothetical protein
MPAVLMVVSSLAGVTQASSTSEQDALVAQHLAFMKSTLDPRAADVLARIDGLGRQLLAARAYSRSRATLAARWSWSQDEMSRYPGSPLQAGLDAEIAKVRTAFEAENPSFTLWVNPEVRALELQLQRWNENESVGIAGTALLEQVRGAVTARGFPKPGTAQGRERFDQLLSTSTLETPPALAAPGLSAHGRMQAVDFQVMQGEKPVAGPNHADVTAVWLSQGWRDRLLKAVQASSECFKGPLQIPEEPWHYEYRC